MRRFATFKCVRLRIRPRVNSREPRRQAISLLRAAARSSQPVYSSHPAQIRKSLAVNEHASDTVTQEEWRRVAQSSWISRRHHETIDQNSRERDGAPTNHGIERENEPWIAGKTTDTVRQTSWTTSRNEMAPTASAGTCSCSLSRWRWSLSTGDSYAPHRGNLRRCELKSQCWKKRSDN